MNAYPCNLRVVSLHLSRTLDEIGLNTRTVKRRRDLFLQSEQTFTTLDRIRGNSESYAYHFGSQTEGATTPGLCSDIDTLHLLNGYNVIDDWTHWERGKINLLMLQEDTAPGYCRLQQLRSDIPTALQFVPDEDYTYDSRGRVILKNTSIHKIRMTWGHGVRHGPARSKCHMPDSVDSFDRDWVLAFGCKSWPEQANSFTTRQRRYDWPTQRLIEEVIAYGVFIVPVGYKLSPTEHLEWRISASLGERCLMFSLSIVHIKCYVVLKMFMKTFVEPCVGKCISSYHCKTALLYCTENTEPGFWREDNLLQCVAQCLLWLLFWVIVEFCPHFIIYEENLFAGKVTAHNRGALQAVLTELIKCCGRKILNVQIDDLGVQLQRKLNTDPSSIPVLHTVATVTLLGHFEYNNHCNACVYIEIYIKILLQNETPTTTVMFVLYSIRMLKYHMRHSNKHERRAAQTFIEFFYRWLGSLLSLSRNTMVPLYAIKLLHLDENANVTSMLKLASVFYCNGDACKVGDILNRLEQYNYRQEIQPVCGCYDKSYHTSLYFCRKVLALKDRRRRSARFAQCVTFSPQEIHCSPPALRHELFRSVGDDIQHRHPKNGRWMCLACVDCRPYLYYLQYITYIQLEQRDLQTQALNNLYRCIKEDVNISHLETSWNLLGQCMESEQQPETAMECYRRSLEIRPRNNAANWHVATLCYRLIRDGY